MSDTWGRQDLSAGAYPNSHYDAPHDIGHQYLQWALHQSKSEVRSDVAMLPTCLHCGGTAPCTAKVCINCDRPHMSTPM
jgi:hypothetical protein